MKCFDMYKDLKSDCIADKELEIVRSGLDEIIEVYEKKYLRDEDRRISLRGEGLYYYLLEEAGKIDYRLKDIEEFSKVLGNYKDEKGFVWSGIYLSALINNKAKDGDFIMLNLGNDCNDLEMIGYKLNKDINLVTFGCIGVDSFRHMEKGNVFILGNPGVQFGSIAGGEITVYGDCENDAGFHMEGGIINIYGNCGKRTASFMKGGEIILHGNCGDELGTGMVGGKVTVKGNCGKSIGYGGFFPMKGGTIYLEGDYKSISKELNQTGGEIYHKGVKIWS